MDYLGGSFEVGYPMFTELVENVGSPLSQLTPRIGLKSFGLDSSGASREAAIEPRTNTVMLNHQLIGGDVNRPEIPSRLVQRLDLDRRDDTEAFIQTLIARHLDAAAEENSTQPSTLVFGSMKLVSAIPTLCRAVSTGCPCKLCRLPSMGNFRSGQSSVSAY